MEYSRTGGGCGGRWSKLSWARGKQGRAKIQIREKIQLAGPVHRPRYLASSLLVAGDTPHATPHIVLLEFLFQLPPVTVPTLLNPHLKFSLNLFHHLPVSVSKGPLLLIQEDLDVSGDPGFVFWKIAYSLCCKNIIHAEVDVPCYTIR